MRTACPACGAEMSLDAMIAHDAARAAIAAAMGLDLLLGKALVQYLALFRPARRSLSFDRVASLLNELVPLIQAGRIERGSRIVAAPRESWKLAIEAVLAQRGDLQLPLKSHGYLLSVLCGMAEKAESQAETRTEQQRAGHAGAGSHRSQTSTVGVPAAIQAIAGQPRTAMPAAARQHLDRFLKRKPQHDTFSAADPGTTPTTADSTGH